MKQINKTIIIAVITLIAGGAIGYMAGQRTAGVGPLAGLQGQQSSANAPGGACGLLQWNIDNIRANDDGSSAMRRAYEAAIREYNRAGCGRAN